MDVAAGSRMREDSKKREIILRVVEKAQAGKQEDEMTLPELRFLALMWSVIPRDQVTLM